MLSKAEETYIAELVKGKSQRQAYLIAYPHRAKWKDDTIDKRASELYLHGKNGEIKGRYEELLKKTAEHIENKCLVDVEYVITGIKEVAERCMQRKAVMVFDKEQKQYVQARDEETGEGIWTFDSAGANRSLELLGKHLKLFTDKTELSGKDGGPITFGWLDE